ncbi:MAG: biotin/lipoyl-binding protein [Betaproteobacteria bacterium]|nr:biotin/lipoyl-binding protein [Betaproteobacteria bacterium]
MNSPDSLFGGPRRGSFLALLAGALLVSSCSKAPAPGAPPPLVKTVVVGQSHPLATTARAIDPNASRTSPSQARAELSGEVLEVLVRSGQQVAAGQALVRIDPRDAKLADSSAKVQVQAARAELASAEADFARYTELRQKSFISQAEWERRSAALANTRGQFEATLDRLGVSSVRALQAARVERVLVAPGQFVQAGQLVAGLHPDRPIAAFAESGGASRSARGLSIPTTALLDGSAVMVVEVLKDGGARVVRRNVRISRAQEQEVFVLEGLAEGDRVVSIGAHLLADGQTVRVVELGSTK